MTSPIDVVLSRLPDAKRSGGNWKARCLAHDDRNPSLSIWERDDGSVGVKCQAGCDDDRVLAVLGLTGRDLQPDDPRSRTGKGMHIVKTYGYVDDAGAERYQKVRYEPKDFRIRRLGPNGKWIYRKALEGQPTLVYRQPEVKRAPKGAVIAVAGGEKDADALRDLGYVATCNIDGEGNWRPEHAAHLPDGCRLVVMLDNDKAGEKFGRLVASSMAGRAAWIKLIGFLELAEHGDVSDFLANGGTKEELEARIEAAPEWSPDSEPWGEFEPLRDRAVPEFDPEVLPPVLSDFVKAVSLSTQTPPDLAASVSLAACAAAAARLVDVEARPGFVEPINLFVAPILDPANRKSAVFSVCTKPLMEVEQEEAEIATPILAADREDRALIESRIKHLRRQFAKEGNEDARNEAKKLAGELAQRPIPCLPRRIISDSTPEAVAIKLDEQGGRIASFSAEGGCFDVMGGLYSKNSAPNFDVFLKGHAGDDLVVDRVSRDPLCVQRPAVTCCYTIQEQVIAGLAHKAALRGRGLLGRFLYFKPRSWIGRRLVPAPPVPQAVEDAYAAVVTRLAANRTECRLTLTPEARNAFEDWEREIESLLREGESLEMIRDWGGKLAGATLRLAGVMHVVEHGVGAATAISLETMRAAIQLGRYLIPHAEAALELMGGDDDQATDDAAYLWRWIRDHDQFSARDARRHGQHRFRDDDERFDAAIDVLEGRNYIRLLPAENRRGRPSPQFEVNPAAVEEQSSRSTCQNRQNPPDDPPDAVSGIFGSMLEESEIEIPEDEWEAA